MPLPAWLPWACSKLPGYIGSKWPQGFTGYRQRYPGNQTLRPAINRSSRCRRLEQCREKPETRQCHRRPTSRFRTGFTDSANPSDSSILGSGVPVAAVPSGHLIHMALSKRVTAKSNGSAAIIPFHHPAFSIRLCEIERDDFLIAERCIHLSGSTCFHP